MNTLVWKDMQGLGKRAEVKFDNGFGASIIDYGYGSGLGLYELAVLRGDKIYYDSPLTNDVLGYLTLDDVMCHLKTIASYKLGARKHTKYYEFSLFGFSFNIEISWFG